jgi:hypothetical protein
MIVIVGGMIRSGSTFSFNIVRELLMLSGPVESDSANSIDGAVLARQSDRHFVLKTHAPDGNVFDHIRSGRLPCICTIRKPEEAVLSWVRTFGFPLEDGIESVRNWLSWHKSVADRVLTIDHDVIDQQPRYAITRIVEFLQCKSDGALIDALEARYEKGALKRKYDALPMSEGTVDLGFSYYDRETFFHRRHISAPAPALFDPGLSSSEIEAIRHRLCDHLGRFQS